LRRGASKPLDVAPHLIGDFPFAELDRDRARLLNLKDPGFLPEFLETLEPVLPRFAGIDSTREYASALFVP